MLGRHPGILSFDGAWLSIRFATDLHDPKTATLPVSASCRIYTCTRMLTIAGVPELSLITTSFAPGIFWKISPPFCLGASDDGHAWLSKVEAVSSSKQAVCTLTCTSRLLAVLLSVSRTCVGHDWRQLPNIDDHRAVCIFCAALLCFYHHHRPTSPPRTAS